MAFNDLFSSARGPGVIGMIMALIVLLGFGLLFMLALDEGAQGGGKSLAAIIRDNETEIEEAKRRIVSGSATLDKIPHLKEKVDALNASKIRNNSLVSAIASLGSSVEEMENANSALIGDWEDYKNKYRAHIRSGAVGNTMSELRTDDGKIYRDVTISKITAMGIDIRHEEGLGRVSYERLPLEMQDLFQFDKQQMLAEANREAETRTAMSQAAARANEAAAVVAEEQKVIDAEEMRKNRVAQIAAKEAQVLSIEGEIRQLEADIGSAERAASSAREAGRRHLNKSGSLRPKLNRKRAELVRVRSEIAVMRASQ